MSKYIEMSLALSKELESVPLEGVPAWTTNNRQKYIDLYKQMKKEKDEYSSRQST